MNRVTIFKSVLWAILGLAVSAGITRLLFGLGSITNLSDATPWGLWKGMNVIPGIALAGGGFVLTAIIYVFGREEYHRYAKISVLLALLGYITAATALVAELGLPWMVWHPIFYWQHHSALFEVSWCVMLYLTVLFLEFLPTPLEEMGWLASVRRFLVKYKIVLVILGIMISTLHQSSLGTMFLITPEKLYPLWYSSLLPIMFFISAVAIGPLMVILAVMTISYLYGKGIEKEKLSKLGLFSVIVLIIFGLVRFIDLAVTGKITMIFNGSWQSSIFILETTLLLIIPIVFIGIKRLRNSRSGLLIGVISGVLGIGLNRADIAGIMLIRTGPQYVPTIFEVFISLGILSAAILVFLFFVERFRMWETKWEDPRESIDARPEFSRASEVWLGTPRFAGRSVYSLIFIISLALGFTLISSDRIKSAGVQDIIVSQARGGDTLLIDGNKDGFGVMFEHKKHEDREGGDTSCVICHHMNIPLDKNSACFKCHRSMYTSTDIFMHDWHASPEGGNVACTKCHPENLPRTGTTAMACDSCHKDLIPPGAKIKIENYDAIAYTDAMHDNCIPCHTERAEQLADKPDLGKCATCHNMASMAVMPKELEAYRDTMYNHIAVPSVDIKKVKGM